MTNRPTFADFIAECVGHRDWYTAARRCPSYEARRGLTFVTRKSYDAITAKYQSLFGVHPHGVAA